MAQGKGKGQRAASRRNRSSTAGDATGRKKAQMERQISDEDRDREKEISLARETEEREKSTKVVDATKGGVDFGDEGEEEVSIVTASEGGSEDETYRALLEHPEESVRKMAQAFFSQQRRASSGEPVEVLVDKDADTNVIVVGEDIDSMTYGHGKHYSFEAGRPYKVPSEIAHHLYEIGLVQQVLR